MTDREYAPLVVLAQLGLLWTWLSPARRDHWQHRVPRAQWLLIEAEGLAHPLVTLALAPLTAAEHLHACARLSFRARLSRSQHVRPLPVYAPFVLRVVCSWCLRVLVVGSNTAATSHTICDVCTAKEHLAWPNPLVA